MKIQRQFHLLLLTALLASAPIAPMAASTKTSLPDAAGTLRASCLAHLEKNETAAAIADCDRAIALQPANRDGYFIRGKAFLFSKNLDRAIADFNRALAIKPDSPGILTLRGLAYARKGDYDRAIADYKKAIKLWPNVRLPQSLLAMAIEAKKTNGRDPATR